MVCSCTHEQVMLVTFDMALLRHLNLSHQCEQLVLDPTLGLLYALANFVQASTGKAAELILNAVKLQIAHAPPASAQQTGRAFATALQLADLSSQVLVSCHDLLMIASAP